MSASYLCGDAPSTSFASRTENLSHSSSIGSLWGVSSSLSVSNDSGIYAKSVQLYVLNTYSRCLQDGINYFFGHFRNDCSDCHLNFGLSGLSVFTGV